MSQSLTITLAGRTALSNRGRDRYREGLCRGPGPIGGRGHHRRTRYGSPRAGR